MDAELNAPDLSFDQVDPVYRGFIDDYLRLHGLDPARFCKPLPGQDEMFFKAILPNYEFDASISAFKFVESTIRLGEAYRQLVEGVFGGFDKVGPVLDFASGWGRLTRYLEQRLPTGQISVADIYHQAIDWQVSTFGVAGISRIRTPRSFPTPESTTSCWPDRCFRTFRQVCSTPGWASCSAWFRRAECWLSACMTKQSCR